MPAQFGSVDEDLTESFADYYVPLMMAPKIGTNPDILGKLERDHQEARSRYGVFGTPTYVFPGGGASYVRLARAPSGSEAIRIFDRIVAVTEDEPTILEIKRPVRPIQD